MSHTVGVHQQQIAFELTNTWNAIVRHCKIGKVTRKPLVTEALRKAYTKYLQDQNPGGGQAYGSSL